MAKKKHYLCGYEKALYNYINMYPIHIGCAEHHVDAKSPTSGEQRRNPF